MSRQAALLGALGLLIASCSSIPVDLPARGAADYPLADTSDLITKLPGIPAGVTFKQYAGYIPVGAGKSLFYWFVESEEKPATDPLVLWTNGGPGCSGLTGFLSEQGPFRANAAGELDLNTYAWNKFANMVFIEQPAGVGFSTAPAGIPYGDEEAATDNLMFVKGFLAKYPQFKSNDFYITSESYGGHYLPTLAAKLVGEPSINFKGFAVGNPLTWMPYRDFGQYATYADHQLVPKPLWDKFVAAGCATKTESVVCQSMMEEMDELTQDLDPYGLDFPICAQQSKAHGRHERHALASKIKKIKEQQGLKGYFPRGYRPCVDDYMMGYLNRKDVQMAIHVAVPGSVYWGPCNDEINAGYNVSDVIAPMMPVYDSLIAHGGLKILVYSGDDDSICSTQGTQMWVWDLKSNKAEGPTDPWRPWYTAKQVSGYTVAWKGMRFATVHGAGHMVPATRPLQALRLFRRFLQDKWGDEHPHQEPTEE